MQELHKKAIAVLEEVEQKHPDMALITSRVLEILKDRWGDAYLYVADADIETDYKAALLIDRRDKRVVWSFDRDASNEEIINSLNFANEAFQIGVKIGMERKTKEILEFLDKS